MDLDDPNYTLIAMTAVCLTQGCSNANIPINVQVLSPTGIVFCGVCCRQITELTQI